MTPEVKSSVRRMSNRVHICISGLYLSDLWSNGVITGLVLKPCSSGIEVAGCTLGS
jgi:hypothetical protein